MVEFKFPWLLSNVLDKRTGKQLAGACEYLEMEWNGVKLGLVGLVEREWLATIPSIDMDQDVIYLDFVEEGKRLARMLKEKGADIVIALTHMRAPNDEILAASVPDIHLILGGHDHSPQADFVAPHGTLLLKSGTDFREFSVLKVARQHYANVDCNDVVLTSTSETVPCCSKSREDIIVSWKRVYVHSESPEDEKVADIVSHYHKQMGTKILSPLGWTLVDLDARFDSVRTFETKIGNLLADVMRLGMGMPIDGALLNSGTIRSDRKHPSGQLTVKDLITMLPFTDELVVLVLDGNDIIEALETSVSAWPAKEGRFLQLSGINYSFDPRKSPGNRVDASSIRINGEPLDLDKLYHIATKAYLRSGKDGFHSLKKADVVMDPETAPRLVTLIHALLSRIQSLNDCLDRGESIESCNNDCSVLRGTRLESLIRFDEQTARYGICPECESRIVNLSESLKEFQPAE